MKFSIKFKGDSGGPCIISKYRDFIICVVKTGSGCGSGAPGVCQKVSDNRPWIESISPKYNFYCYYE